MIAPHPFFEWLAATDVSQTLNGANYVYFGLIMAVHLVGIALLGGVALVVGMKVLDWRLPAVPASCVVQVLRPWFWLGLAVAVATGVWLLVADPLKYSVNPAFQAKAVLLLAAILVQTGLQHLVARASSGLAHKALAVASLLLWLGVATAGRVVGLL